MEKSYSIVIRTLGKGGGKYQQLLNSKKSQTIQPKHLLVFIADGYNLPPEQLGTEEFIYTRKGMWHQRVYGLEYASKLNNSDYILAVDDDISFAPEFAEKSIDWMAANDCDVLAPDLAPCRTKSMFSPKNILYALLGTRVENHFQKWRVKVMATGGFMANTKVRGEAMPTQSAQFAAFFIKAKKVEMLNLKDEYWLEGTKYALPDDQVFFYKCHIMGMKQYMHETITVHHLDHGSSDPKRIQLGNYADGRNFLIFWHRFLYLPANVNRKVWLVLCHSYRIVMHILYLLIRGIVKRDFKPLKAYREGIADALRYINTDEYKQLNRITTQ